MPSNFHKTALLFLFVVGFVASASIFKIADLDFWWHLKTGQIILQQKAFQYHEIYSYTAAGREYIDHEWLFQVTYYLAYSMFGPGGVIFLKTLILISAYLLISRNLQQNGASTGIITLLLMISVCGALQRFIERPETYTILFLVLLYLSLDAYLKSGKLSCLIGVPFIMLLWANTHAAVILGLLMQGIFLVGIIVESNIAKFGLQPHYKLATSRIAIVLGAVLIASFFITLMNPYGFRVLTVPFELTGIIDSGLLKNEEWQRTLPQKLPLFYFSLLFAGLVHVSNYRRISLIHLVLTIMFGWLAIKYVRNTGMFAVLMPLLICPHVENLSTRMKLIVPVNLLAAGGTLAVLTFGFPFQRGIGISQEFPEKLADYTIQRNLQGNMLNSYGFGGYLIWRLFPDRKIFIDGRNEVYLPLLKEIVASRTDSRKWSKLLSDYRVEYALLNYVPDLEKVTILDQNHQARIAYMPFSSTHFPRVRWALIYFDDHGMIFIKRHGVNDSLLSEEYTSVFPEGADYQQGLVKNGTVNKQKATEELERKLNQEPGCRRAQQLLESLRKE